MGYRLKVEGGRIVELGPDDVFVFGSNLAGRHGKGAALEAVRRYGAAPGIGEGLAGRSYALPTKDARLVVRSLDDIATSINALRAQAEATPDRNYYLTRIGQGLASYTEDDIRPLVENAGMPPNLHPWWEWESRHL